MKISVVGIPWYQEQDYETLRQLFDDGDMLPDTYNDWLKAANGLLQSIESSGALAVKANLTPKEFSAWCTSHGMRLNSDARKTFASEVAARMHLDQS